MFFKDERLRTISFQLEATTRKEKRKGSEPHLTNPSNDPARGRLGQTEASQRQAEATTYTKGYHRQKCLVGICSCFPCFKSTVRLFAVDSKVSPQASMRPEATL